MEKKYSTNKGFTFAELMITVTIMMIMTSVVIFNYNQFNDSTLLSQFAYDLSLTIRQAQVYGVATREGGMTQSGQITTANANSNAFKSAYGVHFEDGTNSFFMFVDSGPIPNGKYDSGEVVLQTYTFQRGIKIRRLCFKPDSGNSGTCASGSGGIIDAIGKSAQSLDITFLRPDPEAKIIPNDPSQPVGFAIIYLQNESDTIRRSVSIYSTGQISVQ
jgi:Tfp pilus assembly protein FimT